MLLTLLTSKKVEYIC